MTDVHEDDPPTEQERIEFEPDFDQYGVHPRDESTVILRADSDKHLFERVGLIRHKGIGIVLEQ